MPSPSILPKLYPPPIAYREENSTVNKLLQSPYNFPWPNPVHISYLFRIPTNPLQRPNIYHKQPTSKKLPFPLPPIPIP